MDNFTCVFFIFTYVNRMFIGNFLNIKHMHWHEGIDQQYTIGLKPSLVNFHDLLVDAYV